MTVSQPKTVVIHAHGMVAAMSTNVVVQMLSNKLDFKRVSSIQFIPNGRIRVTSTSVEYRNIILAKKFLRIDDLHELQIMESDSPVTTVYVHYLPPEAGDVGIRLMFAPFGKVLIVTNQHFSGFKQISTGTRIVHMTLEHHIPFQCNIQGYPCRVWYAGQPLKCTICKGAHKAADCPDRNKCKRCHQSGHFAKDCKNAWGTTPQAPNVHADAPPPATHTPIPDPPTSDPSAPAPYNPCVEDPSASDPPVMSSVDSAADPAPPPLMSLNVQPPQQSQVNELVSSQASLFSDAEESIGEFSEEEVPLVVSPSPTISSFPSDNCSQSILKDVIIVSSDQMEVKQIDNSNVNSNVTGNVTGPKVAQGISSDLEGPKVAPSKSNVMGPKVAQNKSNDNVTGPKVAQSKSKVVGPNVAQSKSKVTGSNVAQSKSNVTGAKVTHANTSTQIVLPNSQNSQSSTGQIQQYDFLSSSGNVAVSDSSSSETSFKTPLPPGPPLPPRPRRVPSQSPVRGRSRSPLVPDSPGAHRGMPQVSKDRPSRRS